MLFNRNNYNFHFIFAFVFVLQGFNLYAQDPFLRKYTVDDGLPSSHVYRVFQDSEGFMWVCTDRGLSRFDGYKFENFSGANQLPYNDIWDIAEDKYKRLWLSSFAYAVTYYDIKKRRFYSTHTDNTPSIANKKIFAFSVLDKDNIRIESEDGYLFNLKTLKIQETKKGYYQVHPILDKLDISYPNSFTVRGMSDNYSFILKNNIVIDKKRNLHKGFYKQIIYTDSSDFYLANDTEITYSTPTTNKTIKISDLSKKSKIIVWVSLVGGSKLLLVKTDTEYFIIDTNLNRVARYNFISKYNVNSAYIDNELNFWLCTHNKGLFLLSKEAENSKIFEPLSIFAIKALAKDNNTLWLGTDTGEIFSLKNDKLSKLNLIGYDKLPIREIFVDSRHNVFIVYESGELLLFPSAYSDIKTPFTPVKLRLSDYINPQNIKAYILKKQACSLLIDMNVKDVYERNGIIYLGCSTDIKSIDFTNLQMKINVLYSYRRGVAIAVDNKDSIWIGSSDGLYRSRIGVHKSDMTQKNNLKHLNKTINDLVIDKDENVWIGTDVGKFFIYNGVNYQEIDNLDGIIAKKNYFDQQNNKVWITTNRGIYSFQKNKKGLYSFERISLIHGLPSLEVHSVCTINNNLYAGTNNGLVEMPIHKTTGKTKMHIPLLIKNIFVNASDTTIKNYYSLSHLQNTIKINFVALSYRSDKNITYFYSFGNDEAKNSWNRILENELTFNFLQPGRYTFYLKAIDINGNETTLKSPIIFQINAPYWQTWWFRLLLLLIITGIVGFILLSHRKSTEKELRLSKKLAELELHALQSQMNPHFVFNALSSIQNFILNKDTNAANEYLTNFSKLIRLFLESSRNRYISIADEKILIEKYIQLEQARFRDKFTYEIIEINNIDSNQELPSMLLQPFVENAINHGLVYKEGTGHLIITFKNENQYLNCTIEDDGVGREKAKELRTRAIKAYKSRATEIIDDRLRTLQMVDGTEVEVTIIDKTDEFKNATGTKIIIKILMK